MGGRTRRFARAAAAVSVLAVAMGSAAADFATLLGLPQAISGRPGSPGGETMVPPTQVPSSS